MSYRLSEKHSNILKLGADLVSLVLLHRCYVLLTFSYEEGGLPSVVGVDVGRRVGEALMLREA